MHVPGGLFLCAGAVLESHRLAMGFPQTPNVQCGPKWSQGIPKTSQWSPRCPKACPQDSPKRPQGIPKMPQCSPRYPKVCLKILPGNPMAPQRKPKSNAGLKERLGISKRVQRKPIYTKTPDQPHQRPLCYNIKTPNQKWALRCTWELSSGKYGPYGPHRSCNQVNNGLYSP